MPKPSSRLPGAAVCAALTFLVAAASAAGPGSSVPAMSTTAPAAAKSSATDPYLWLEGVTDEKALAWVRERNAKAEAEIATTPEFKRLRDDLLAILDSTDRIPMVQKIGNHYYNFWRDKAQPRGVWRRTSLEEYRKPKPTWETVLDLDELNSVEEENWVWQGAECLKPDYERCMISLSRGGADANVSREFDLTTLTFVQDGFVRPEAKGGVQWIDRDTVYVFTDFGKGSMTASGYPRIVKEWKRGTPLSEAKTVYEGKPGDMYIAAYRDLTPGHENDFISRTIAFYNDELYWRKDGKLIKIDAPNSATKSVNNDWLTLELRDPWKVGGREYAAGTLLAISFKDFMEGDRNFDVMFEPTDNTSLSSYAWTKNHLVMTVLEDVKSKIRVMTPLGSKNAWKNSAFVGAPAIGTIGISPVDQDNGDEVWMTTTDFLTPTTLSLVRIGKQPEKLKQMPAFFDTAGLVAEQNFATSKDGTRVPYFVVRPKNLAFDGKAPTLLWGYGGFEVSYTATYGSMAGRGWLQQGGVYVLANIRGGGEYGPRWHQAALKANRHKAYEDFAAVAEDLIARNITSAKHLGAQGGSNGGLLMGNMAVQYPQLFGAIVCQVPLLDMQRYTKLLAGASWMAEYGDPDKPAEWAFIKTFSPYHLVKPGKQYPPVLFTTSTRDDRVHPGHARKMMAKMEEMGYDVRYYENIEGGHGGAADNSQEAHMRAMAYTFLWQKLKP
jgi:prolyl oligopeptidase